MSTTLEDVVISFRGDTRDFDAALARSGRGLRGFRQDFSLTASTITRGAAVIAAAGVAIGASALAITRSAAEAGAEIANLSRMANAAPSDFQRWVAGAETVNISAEKMSDILRDVQDRIGDFMSTGGGPMLDFFDNIAPRVGLTADNFARLSGQDALQLYVSALEAANLSQAEMTFYMEAMASDSTALLPLLRNNGQAMRELGDAAERSGRIMSDRAVRSAEQLNNRINQVSATIRGAFNNALMENADAINDAADAIEQNLAPALEELVPAVVWVIEQFGVLIGQMREMIGLVQFLDGIMPGEILGSGRTQAAAEGIRGRISEWWNGPAPYAPEPRGAPLSAQPGFFGAPAPESDPFALPELVYDSSIPVGSGSSGGGGGGGGGDGADNWDALRRSLLTRRELLVEDYELQLEQLREFRENRRITEEEFNEHERRLTEQHQEQLRQIEEQSRQARMQVVAGMFGDLASIIESSGNRNLEVVRGLRVAEAVITGYQAAVDAWQRGMQVGGPPTAALFLAGSLARTGALIAQMKSAQAGGAAGGGGAGVAAGGAAAAAAPLEARVINLDRAGFYRGEVFGDILEGLMEEAEDRGLRLTVGYR